MSSATKPKRLLKSRPRPVDWAAGNGAKFLSYSEAWARIRLATKQGFFLEAVTLEESIISDRLSSFLIKDCGFDSSDKRLRNLHNLAAAWAKTARIRLVNDPALLRQLAELERAIDRWRDTRNEVVHGLVKSRAGRGDDHIQGFLERARDSALVGRVLARGVSSWVESARKSLSQMSRADRYVDEAD